ncbi:MAG TPA: hypothetical protein VG389_26995 [Myxococcota bacterium]|nr:hypothetical protein [Myxococcota bacterium]
MEGPRPAGRAALVAALAALLAAAPAVGCRCGPLGPRAVLVPGDSTIAVGSRADVVLIACKVTFDWNAAAQVAVIAAIFTALGRVDVLAYVPQALIPGCDPIDYTVSSVELDGDPAFTIEPHDEPWLYTLRADAAGAATFRVTIDTDDGPLVAESHFTAMVADRVEMAPHCDAGDAAAGSGVEERADLLPVDTLVSFAYGLFAGDMPLSGYDFYPVDAFGLTYVGPAADGVAYQTAPAPGPAGLTSSVDPDFALDLSLYELGAFDALDVRRADTRVVYVGGWADLAAFALAAGAAPCVDAYPRTYVVETPATCSFPGAGDTLAHPGPTGVLVQGDAEGVCRVRATLDGTALSGTVELSFARGWAPVDVGLHGATTAHAVWGSGAGDVFVVGRSGGAPMAAPVAAAVLHFDGRRWTRTLPGVAAELEAVWGSGPGDVFAVGTGGAVLHYDGAAWTAADTGGYEVDLHAVSGSGPGDVYAVGDGSVMLHWDGAVWTGDALGAGVSLRGVWASAPDDVYVVGPRTWNAATVLRRWDGLQWLDVLPAGLPEEASLFAVWGSGAGDVWAAGETTFLHRDAGAFAPYPLGFGYDVYALWGTAASDVFAVGTGVLHFDGGDWTGIPFPPGGPLASVWASGPADAFAVSAAGALFRYHR